MSLSVSPAPPTMTSDDPGAAVFRSRSHPGDRPRPLAYARAFVTPLATCMLPVMIVVLVAVLEGVYVLPIAATGFGTAVLAASAWTAFQIRRRPAEVLVRPGEAAVLTVWEAAGWREPARWGPVLDVRDYGSWLFAAVGDQTYQLERSEWPSFDPLLAALRAARRTVPRRPESWTDADA